MNSELLLKHFKAAAKFKGSKQIIIIMNYLLYSTLVSFIIGLICVAGIFLILHVKYTKFKLHHLHFIFLKRIENDSVPNT